MRLVTVAVYPNAHQAHLARALLNDAGIPAFVAGEYGNLFAGDGDIQVRVPEDVVEAAQTVLEAADGDSSTAPD